MTLVQCQKQKDTYSVQKRNDMPSVPQRKIYPGKRPQTVCARSLSRKSRDLDALGSREVMVVITLVSF